MAKLTKLEKLKKQIEKILSWLPFDGSKLRLGAIFVLIGQIQQYVSGADLISLIKAIAANPTATGIALVLTGYLHDQLKKKYGGK